MPSRKSSLSLFSSEGSRGTQQPDIFEDDLEASEYGDKLIELFPGVGTSTLEEGRASNEAAKINYRKIFASLILAPLYREPLPTFNIEKDGDSRISWIMYYDFIVTKTEAFYQLQPGYLPTASYPSRRNAEEIISNGKKVYPCGVLNCKSKPFTRHCDLERHFRTMHKDDRDQIYCDYSSCIHKDSFRKDHCREHYREYHGEDLIKRGKNFKSVEDSLAGLLDNIDLNWWRCCKCFQRVNVSAHEYTCPDCKVACEPWRVAWRDKASIPKNSGCDMEKTERFSTPEKTSLMVEGITWQRYGSIPGLEDHGEIKAVELTAFDCWCFFWYRASSPLSFIAGLFMVALFLWSNQRMELDISSDFVQQIVAVSMRAIPAQVVKASNLVPSGLILVSYLLTSGIWAVSSLGWIATHLRSSYLGYLYFYILLATAFWSLQGLNAGELFLAFLPLSVCIGTCLYSICGGPIIHPPACKRCVKGQSRYERLTSIAIPPIQGPYPRKPALDASHNDLERNVKG